MRKLGLLLSVCVAIIGFAFPMISHASTTGTVDATDHYSRLCKNIDCTVYSRVNWAPTNTTAPVSISDYHVSGIIWAEDIGWINLAPTTAMTLDPTHAGVHNDAVGHLSGYAWGEIGSWVNFSPTHGGVFIDSTTGEFSGYAWVSNYGWMLFDCSKAYACVKTDWHGAATGTTCNDPTADNYGADATCTYTTCNDPTATNYGAVGACTYPATCTDPTATNYGGLAPCTYAATCTDPAATNYGAVGACTYPATCTDPTATNYGGLAPCTYAATCTDPAATNYGAVGSCIYPHCSDPSATNYGGIGSCIYGTGGTTCTDPTATNYGAATTCVYATPTTCTDTNATNYGAVGACVYATVVTCTDLTATNYGAQASCEYPHCTDPTATNYGAIGGCQYPTQIKQIIGNTTTTITKTTTVVKNVINTETGTTVTHTVSTVGAVGTTAVTVTTGIFLNPLAISDLLLIPLRLWSLLLGALGLAKRKKPWGTVYDSVTKQPIDPAYVILRNSEGKDVATAITDLDGRYGFVVPEAGNYVLVANKTNYLFPSQKLVGYDHDELYRDLYFGEHFKISEAGEIITKNIPMDPIKFDWNEFAKRQQHLMKFYTRKEKWLARISNTFFYIGFTVASISVLSSMTHFNIGVFCLYVLLFVVRSYGLGSRAYGHIVNEETNEPLSYALVRISQAGTGVEVMHRVADAIGRYYCLLPNGDYTVRVDRKLPDSKYETIAEKIPVHVKKGYLSARLLVPNKPLPPVAVVATEVPPKPAV